MGLTKTELRSRCFNKTFSFIKHRKIFYIVSVSIIVIGLLWSVIFGMNYGIDFTGGTTIQVDLGKQVAIEDVEKTLKVTNLIRRLFMRVRAIRRLLLKPSSPLIMQAETK